MTAKFPVHIEVTYASGQRLVADVDYLELDQPRDVEQPACCTDGEPCSAVHRVLGGRVSIRLFGRADADKVRWE